MCIRDSDWTEDKEYSFTDEYDFDEIYDEEDSKCIVNYIKKDLKLVAGGGYNSDPVSYTHLFTSYCLIFGVDADAKECDDILFVIREVLEFQPDVEEFEQYMIELIV